MDIRCYLMECHSPADKFFYGEILMEDIKEKKDEIAQAIQASLDSNSEDTLNQKLNQVEERLSNLLTFLNLKLPCFTWPNHWKSTLKTSLLNVTVITRSLFCHFF
jgi:hypothetical protein